ncbi:DUF262 domain-containing protein [Leadbettera azotonutricia]|uniref:Uncharacterized protein n=1 Tax=Leadbettera azotonutricia (strain ATCC BAA-888 / DSM 13862 / ZAS-9) TaxID=545695 RepID=F5YAM6_LEAAZ|nr:DUF262 domain-containing protein [Leadbettera azotonutricia]AEF80563.1 conserved hypothetical protein [Leadbettera azotonutricia ZAS-9]
MEENKNPVQAIVKLRDLINTELIIPPYQRPYKWQSNNVIHLLDDIFENVIQNKRIYRIGNIILHEDKEKKQNIVDGQQRLTTISILLNCLDISFSGLLLKQKFKHKISKDNIFYNKRIIDNWSSKIIDKNFVKNTILEKCEFVLFTVYKEDEAFQLFDSQNARGQSLKPYDLLKAFHLREMEFETEEEKAACVKRWEKSIDNGSLKTILGNHLFRIRKWSKNDNKYNFTKDEIDEFKGISLYKNQEYPYEKALRMLDGLVENAQKDKLLMNLDVAQTYPFSITMTIINGKRFFEYVDYYISLKDNLVKNDTTDFYRFHQFYCLGNSDYKPEKEPNEYIGAGRSGDEKVKNLYENIVLSFVDKFGEITDFNVYFEAFYKIVYLIRCKYKSIRMETILNSDVKKIVREIGDAVMPEQLNKYQFRKNKIDELDFVKGIEPIKNFISSKEEENGR